MSESKTTDIRSLNIYQKLAAITGDIGVVEKGGMNNEQKYHFIEYAAVAGRLRTLFDKYGVIMVPRMAKTADQQRAEITSKYGAKGVAVMIDFEFEVINADKPDDRFTVTWVGEAADYGDKATNKAATSAIKYYQMRQFNISEQGDDPDAQSPDIGTEGPVTPDPIKRAQPASPKPDPLVSPAKISMMLGQAKFASGKEAREEIIAFFTDETGKKPTEVHESELPGILAHFKSLSEGVDPEVES